jgi:Mor family transcriptional regulator
MGYKNAVAVLPEHLLATVQQYIDGDYLYIPRKIENKKAWGEIKNSRYIYTERNIAIFKAYTCGKSVAELAEIYYLSCKTVYKIVSMMKKRT